MPGTSRLAISYHGARDCRQAAGKPITDCDQARVTAFIQHSRSADNRGKHGFHREPNFPALRLAAANGLGSSGICGRNCHRPSISRSNGSELESGHRRMVPLVGGVAARNYVDQRNTLARRGDVRRGHCTPYAMEAVLAPGRRKIRPRVSQPGLLGSDRCRATAACASSAA